MQSLLCEANKAWYLVGKSSASLKTFKIQATFNPTIKLNVLDEELKSEGCSAGSMDRPVLPKDLHMLNI